jgi:decaprenylphospho-beta-D-erythro-pentofuranosid-2-ulose 2-reductase
MRRVWILGATSAIAHAYARLQAQDGASLLLAGRNAEHLHANAADLSARGAAACQAEVADFANTADCEAVVARWVASHGAPDDVLIAYGVGGGGATANADPKLVRSVIDANFTSVVLWVLALLAKCDSTRPMTLAVISSVAGDRGRRRNVVYGASKGGLDRFLEGLQHAHANSAVRIVRIKPGFVDTPMTAAMQKSALWARADHVAADIDRAMRRGQRVLYTPWYWRPIMLVIRHLPWFLFGRLKV